MTNIPIWLRRIFNVLISQFSGVFLPVLIFNFSISCICPIVAISFLLHSHYLFFIKDSSFIFYSFYLLFYFYSVCFILPYYHVFFKSLQQFRRLFFCAQAWKTAADSSSYGWSFLFNILSGVCFYFSIPFKNHTDSLVDQKYDQGCQCLEIFYNIGGWLSNGFEAFKGIWNFLLIHRIW